MIAPGRNDIRTVAGVLLLALLVAPVLACPYDTGGHLVKFNVIDAHTTNYGFNWYNPVPNATVIATGITVEQSDWLSTLFGIKPTISEIKSTEQKGITDEHGVVILPLYSAMLYNLTVVCEGGETTMAIYPSENEYNLYIGKC